MKNAAMPLMAAIGSQKMCNTQFETLHVQPFFVAPELYIDEHDEHSYQPQTTTRGAAEPLKVKIHGGGGPG
jgi:hypothetical protein